MSNKISTVLVIAVIILTAFAVLGIRGCIDNRRTSPPSPIQQAKDSVKRISDNTQHIIDSLKKETVIVEHQKDSLARVAEKQTDIIAVRTAQVISWKKQYELSRKYADTPTALLACDSLANQVDSLNNEVAKEQSSNRELQRTSNQLLSNSSLRAARLEYDLTHTKEQFDNVTGSGLQMEKELEKLRRKDKRRISFGSGVGGTLINGKVVPVVEILSIHYSWFKL